MLLLSYKSTRSGLSGIANMVIRLRLKGLYSHTELLFEPDDAVDALLPDGVSLPINGAYWCGSSVATDELPTWSPVRSGARGGVRFKRIAPDPDKWDVVPVYGDPVAVARWFNLHQGCGYDWSLILGFIVWWVPGDSRRYSCSEACAEALGYCDSWRFDPCTLRAALTR